MSQNVISAQFPQHQLNQVMETISTLKTQLAFLIDLDTEQRKSLVKMGDRSQVFVERALEVAQDHSDILPRRFDLEEFEQDTVLAARLNRVNNALLPLMNMLDDSLLAAGSDAYSQALEVYAYAKAAGTGEGLEELRQTMSSRFSRQRTRNADSQNNTEG